MRLDSPPPHALKDLTVIPIITHLMPTLKFFELAKDCSVDGKVDQRKLIDRMMEINPTLDRQQAAEAARLFIAIYTKDNN